MATLGIGPVVMLKQRAQRIRHRTAESAPLHPAGKDPTVNALPNTTPAQPAANKMLQPKVVGSVLLGKDRILKVSCEDSSVGRECNRKIDASVQDYKFGEVLGAGAFGVVRLAWGRSNLKKP
jgi:hypothetical protein